MVKKYIINKFFLYSLLVFANIFFVFNFVYSDDVWEWTITPQNSVIEITESQSFVVEVTRGGSNNNISVVIEEPSPSSAFLKDKTVTTVGRLEFTFDSPEYIKKNPQTTYTSSINFKFKACNVLRLTQCDVQDVELKLTDSSLQSCGDFNVTTCDGAMSNRCFWSTKLKCVSRFETLVCKDLEKESECKMSEGCRWDIDKKECSTKDAVSVESEAVSNYLKDKYGVPPGYQGPLPDCAFSGECRNINDLLQLFINYGEGIFAIIAGFAFAFFVYGGFLMIFSFGNAERVKKGQQVLIAAVVGLVIVFSAYIMVDFLLDALGVDSTFRGVG
ncbi:hypothetical protein C0581_04065 [Candidatus Parcubacteria bacterium]|nr:MAG: hypothetical protein C0581_04065 [Candidatus Parcubacteria bacterium]